MDTSVKQSSIENETSLSPSFYPYLMSVTTFSHPFTKVAVFSATEISHVWIFLFNDTN